jgi:hypothetical protein
MAFRRDGTSELDEERDFLRQQIKKLAAALARIVLGVKGAGEADVALAEARRAVDEILGVPTELLDRLDAGTAAGMLRTPDRLRAYADLCAARFEILRQQGVVKDELRERALLLYRVVLAGSPGDPEVVAAMGTLEAR